MTGKLCKAFLSCFVVALFSIFSVFCVSAASADDSLTEPVAAASPGEKKLSTLDEQHQADYQGETLPTMKPSYLLQRDSEVSVNETVPKAEVRTTQPSSAVSTVPGATSKVSTFDTPSPTTTVAVGAGVVQTSDSPLTILVLVGLIAATCLVIGIHKKDLIK